MIGATSSCMQQIQVRYVTHSRTIDFVDRSTNARGPGGDSNVPEYVWGFTVFPFSVYGLGVRTGNFPPLWLREDVGECPTSPALQTPHFPSAIVLCLFVVYHGLYMSGS